MKHNIYLLIRVLHFSDKKMPINKIAILNAGSQYTKLIDGRVRGLNCDTSIFELSVPAEILKDYSGVILSGGPDSVYQSNAAMCDPKIFDLGIPILGLRIPTYQSSFRWVRCTVGRKRRQ
jgi:hypothetical protein